MGTLSRTAVALAIGAGAAWLVAFGLRDSPGPPPPGEATSSTASLAAEFASPLPFAATDSVWMEDLTWMEVRDAIAAGKTSVVVPTGGIEQNGPYLVTGKHDVIVRGQCESIARRLGNALCAPVVPFVPEGDIEARTGHMQYPGTISVGEETFRRLLEDIAASLEATGFREVLLIGDSGGNQSGMAAVAESLSGRWSGRGSIARYIPEYYDNDALAAYLKNDLGIVESGDDGYHDSYAVTAQVMAVDPEAARYSRRAGTGRASINGVGIEPLEKTVRIGRKLIQWRTDRTVKAIEAARAARPVGGH